MAAGRLQASAPQLGHAGAAGGAREGCEGRRGAARSQAACRRLLGRASWRFAHGAATQAATAAIASRLARGGACATVGAQVPRVHRLGAGTVRRVSIEGVGGVRAAQPTTQQRRRRPFLAQARQGGAPRVPRMRHGSQAQVHLRQAGAPLVRTLGGRPRPPATHIGVAGGGASPVVARRARCGVGERIELGDEAPSAATVQGTCARWMDVVLACADGVGNSLEGR